MLLIMSAGSSKQRGHAHIIGSKCKYSHDNEAMAMLTEVQKDDEEDYVVEMFQQSTMAQAEPHIAMQIMQGIEGFDTP